MRHGSATPSAAGSRRLQPPQAVRRRASGARPAPPGPWRPASAGPRAPLPPARTARARPHPPAGIASSSACCLAVSLLPRLSAASASAGSHHPGLPRRRRVFAAAAPGLGGPPGAGTTRTRTGTAPPRRRARSSSSAGTRSLGHRLDGAQARPRPAPRSPLSATTTRAHGAAPEGRRHHRAHAGRGRPARAAPDSRSGGRPDAAA